MRPWMRSTLEHLVCLGLIAAGAFAALYPVVLQGRVPIPVAGTLFTPPWEEARPSGLEPTGQPSQAAARQYYPWYAFLSDAAERNDSLLWDPVEGCGIPFFASWRSRCLSPFSLPFYFFDVKTGLRLSAFLKVFVAGLCGLVAGRRLGFVPSLSLFIALSFQLSAIFFYWLASPLSDTLPWLPLLLIFVDRLALGRIQYWPCGALVLAAMLLGGEPEALGGLLIVTMIFIIARNLLGQRGGTQLFSSISTYVIAVVVAAALCGVQVLPFYELVRESASLGNLEPAADLKLTHVAGLFLPHLFGRTPYSLASEELCAEARVALLLHVGIIQLSLIPLWFALRRYSTPPQRHRIEALLIASAGAVFLSVLGWTLLADVFPFRRLRPEHLLAAGPLLAAVIAAAAAEEWVSLDAEACKHTLKRLAMILPVVFVGAAIIGALGWQSAKSEQLHLAGQALIPAISFLLVALLILVTLLKPSQRLIGYSLCVLTILQSMAVFHPGNTYPAFMPPETVFPSTDFVAALKESGLRAGGSLHLKDWPLTGNLISQTYAPSGVVLKRHRAFFEASERDPLLLRRTGAGSLVLAKEDIQGVFAPVRPLLRLSHVLPSGAGIFEDLEAKPRAWLAFDWRPVETFNPEQLDGKLPPLVEGPVPPAVEGSDAATATILPESTNACLQIAIESDKAGVLYLADAWYPGWNAVIDGKPAEIFPVDGLFRGLRVPEGTSRIEMVYEPRSLVMGAWTSLGAAAVTAGFVLYLGFRWLLKRHRARRLEQEYQSSPAL
ncbi:MAG TPA: YfhO family protein [Candidatus Hydrogenedentes bacterium]|nr:YfhO family protein [Candidatus Hydrogenedentota bacterium]HQE82850.1 YfhO family protein [Candidatus Hydrogenedentota bacterium]HQH53003.1 YfhO family protein [Candidatus Hydrogenedentota bacterium]HQM49294.1 YfhO family protein [Candidatus Hydrogenedentota bacterium]